MKNLKFNKKRLTALLLAGNMLLFGGCGKSEEIDECKVINPYNLSDTLVVTRSDDTIDVAKKVYISESVLALHYEHKDHDHYKSLITKDIYSTDECDIDKASYAIFPIASAGTMIHYSQLTSKNISYYLTEDELLKIKNGEFTKTDEDNVLSRIMAGNVELENSVENDTVDIDGDVKTYDLKGLFVSVTSSPSNEVKMPYIFLQTNFNPEYYKEYRDEFFTVDKDYYGVREAYENNFQDWNQEFVISNSIEPLLLYLTEEEMKNSKDGQITELQLDGILDRIRSDYKQKLSENDNVK